MAVEARGPRCSGNYPRPCDKHSAESCRDSLAAASSQDNARAAEVVEVADGQWVALRLAMIDAELRRQATFNLAERRSLLAAELACVEATLVRLDASGGTSQDGAQ